MSSVVTLGKTVFLVPDLTCASVYSVFPAVPFKPGCSTDPVGVNTVMTYRTSAGTVTATVSSVASDFSSPFDATVAAQFWVFALVTVVSLYFFSLSVTSVLAFIRGRG